MTSTQHRNAIRSTAAPAQPADLSHDCGTRQGAGKRDRQPQHHDLQRVAMEMRRGLKPVSDASHHAVDQLEICKSIAKAFERGKRFYQCFVVHDASCNVLKHHQTTAATNRTVRLLLIRRCAASEQFYSRTVLA